MKTEQCMFCCSTDDTRHLLGCPNFKSYSASLEGTANKKPENEKQPYVCEICGSTDDTWHLLGCTKINEQKPENKGPKETSGKVRWKIFPFKEAEYVVKVFEYGASEMAYKAPFTYRKGIDPADLAEAAIRHSTAILAGEMIDPESGLPHAAHIAANGLMIISQYEREK